jgi:hypothetical protein
MITLLTRASYFKDPTATQWQKYSLLAADLFITASLITMIAAAILGNRYLSSLAQFPLAIGMVLTIPVFIAGQMQKLRSLGAIQ